MARYEVPLSGAGPYYLVMYTAQAGRTVGVDIYWRRNSYGYSSYNGSASWSITIAGVSFSGTVNFNAPAGGAIGETLIASRSQYISSGYNVYCVGYFNSDVSPGSATAAAYENLPVPATAPPAPKMRVPDQITQTSMRVQFDSQGDGGSAVTSWGLQRATDQAFTQNVVQIGSSGTSVVTGLNPGTQYWWRARGQNAIGVGAWSSAVSATTLPGGRRKVAGSWKNVIRWLKVSGVWRRTRRWRKVNGAWVLTR